MRVVIIINAINLLRREHRACNHDEKLHLFLREINREDNNKKEEEEEEEKTHELLC